MIAMAPVLLCQYCQEPVRLGDQLLPTGAVCAKCDRQRPAPTSADVVGPELVVDVERRAMCEIADPVTFHVALEGYRLPDFAPPRGTQFSIEIEEWIFAPRPGGGWEVVSTPRDLYPGRALTSPRRRSAFVVVLEWQHHEAVLLRLPAQREIGPLSFAQEGVDRSVCPERTQALNVAQDWALRQARRLNAAEPFGYRPARTFPGGV